MVEPYTRALRPAGLCLAFWGAMAAAATAQTFQVTVGGTAYDITIDGYVPGLDIVAANGPGHADGRLTAFGSWFGNATLAETVAGGLPFAKVPDGIDNVFFAHSVDGVAREVSYFDRASGGAVGDDARGLTPAEGAEGGDLTGSEAWAYGTATPAPSTRQGTPPASVPEIDGPVLAQALFVLFALYATLAGRRRRRQP